MSYDTTHPAQVAEPDLRAAAARTLDAVPGAEAVLLFGSRARGSALPDSDWDVAIVTSSGPGRREPFRRTPIEELDPRVNARYLSRDQLHDRRNSPGHIAREVPRDGRLLAGRMPRVGRVRRNPPMEHDEFIDKSTAAASALAETGSAFAKALAEPHRAVLVGSAPSFVRRSADAAECLAKLTMFPRGAAPPRWHNLNGLADCLEGADGGNRWREARKRSAQRTRPHAPHGGVYRNQRCRHRPCDCSPAARLPSLDRRVRGRREEASGQSATHID